MIPKPDSAAGVQSPSLREGRVRARHPPSPIPTLAPKCGIMAAMNAATVRHETSSFERPLVAPVLNL